MKIKNEKCLELTHIAIGKIKGVCHIHLPCSHKDRNSVPAEHFSLNLLVAIPGSLGKIP